VKPASLLEALVRYCYPSRYDEALTPVLSRATSLKLVLTASGDMERRTR
jgi:hypothetical protein